MIEYSPQGGGGVTGKNMIFIQGGNLSTTRLNIELDEVVHQCIVDGCGMEVYSHGIGCTVGDKEEMFYGDNVKISGADSGWVKVSFGVMQGMFEWVELQTNSAKKNTCFQT